MTCTHALGRASDLPPEFYLHVNVRLGHRAQGVFSLGNAPVNVGGGPQWAQEGKFGTRWRRANLNSARK